MEIEQLLISSSNMSRQHIFFSDEVTFYDDNIGWVYGGCVLGPAILAMFCDQTPCLRDQAYRDTWFGRHTFFFHLLSWLIEIRMEK
jgi:hypothetical protein